MMQYVYCWDVVLGSGWIGDFLVNKTLCCRLPGPNRHLDEGPAKGEYPEPHLLPHQELILPVHQDHQFLLPLPRPQMIGENDPGVEYREHQDISEPQPMRDTSHQLFE